MDAWLVGPWRRCALPAVTVRTCEAYDSGTRRRLFGGLDAPRSGSSVTTAKGPGPWEAKRLFAVRAREDETPGVRTTTSALEHSEEVQVGFPPRCEQLLLFRTQALGERW